MYMLVCCMLQFGVVCICALHFIILYGDMCATVHAIIVYVHTMCYALNDDIVVTCI